MRICIMPIAHVNGIDLSYEVQGQGPALASIHGGWGGVASSALPRAEAWMKDLADSYTVVDYDRRSSGRTEYPSEEYSLAMLAEDLRALLRHLGIDRAFILGTSAGGSVAISYTLAYPESVLGLILVSTSAALLKDVNSTPGFADTVRSRIETLRRDGPEAAWNQIVRDQRGAQALAVATRSPFQPPSQDISSGTWMATLPQPLMPADVVAERQKLIAEAIAKLSEDEKRRQMIGELRNMAMYLDADLGPRLGEIQAPTLVLHTEADPFFPLPVAEGLAQRIPNAELVVLPGAGHGIGSMAGADTALRGWLNRHAPTASVAG
jgi:pimeloyl-ACP methyl ester carboxylesterase